MRKRSKTSVLALCGVLAALALALMFLGGVLPFATIACPVLASLVLLPVYIEAGRKWSAMWYLAVAVLSLFLAPEKETAVLFVFFGYYPVLHKWLGRLPGKMLKWLAKLCYVNLAVAAAYSLLLFVFPVASLTEEFAQTQKWLLAVMLLLANFSFVIYDVLLDRLEVFYHVKLRPKLKL